MNRSPLNSNIIKNIGNESSDQNDSDIVVAGLQKYDVLTGRDKEAFRHIGNRRFRTTVKIYLPRYQSATSRQEKSQIIREVAEQVRQNGGRFVKRRRGGGPGGGHLVELSEKRAHEKVGHSLRDMSQKRSKEDGCGMAELLSQQQSSGNCSTNTVFSSSLSNSCSSSACAIAHTASTSPFVPPLSAWHNAEWSRSSCTSIAYHDGPRTYDAPSRVESNPLRSSLDLFDIAAAIEGAGDVIFHDDDDCDIVSVSGFDLSQVPIGV